MKKYLLTFKDPQIEEQYQKTCVGKARIKMFEYMVFGLSITFSIRSVYGLINKNYYYSIANFIIICCLIIQYALAKKFQNLIRIFFVLINHAITIYLQFVEESSDPYSAYLRGVNQMGTNLLIIFSGEYIEAIISLFSLQIIRIIIIFMKSQEFEFYAIFSALLLIGFASKQLHEYHLGLRSQFLLSIREKQWDNIFKQIIIDIPYLLLTFDEENLKYERINIQNCSNFIQNVEEATKFLRNSTKNGQSLESLIFNQIKDFQKNYQDNYNEMIQLCFNKKQLLLSFSIFNGNKPQILLVFKDPQELQIQSYRQKKQFQYHNDFFYFFYKLSCKLQKSKNPSKYLLKLKRKLCIIKFLQDLNFINIQTKPVDLNCLLKKIQRLYPDKMILYNQQTLASLISIRDYIQILFLIILESLESKIVRINNKNSLQQLEFKLVGKFDSTELLQFYSKYNQFFDLIMNKFKISEEYISFILYSNAYTPFNF